MCSVCNDILVAQEEIPALGHTYSKDWKHDANSHWHECETCGHVADKENHHGGNANFLDKAICDECSVPYGDYLSMDETINRVTEGCTGSIITSLFGILGLTGAVVILRKKREE